MAALEALQDYERSLALSVNAGAPVELGGSLEALGRRSEAQDV
jgi:hypothetical protein